MTARIDTEALKRERPLADVIASSGIQLRREGAGTFRALCPFHEERTPSFWVDARDASDEHFFCFGCEQSGDVIDFVMAREGCSFVEACERLATRGRPPLVHPLPAERSRPTGRRWETLPLDSPEARVLDLACQVYQERLWETPRALAYLRGRGVPDALAREQRLGYADGRSLLGHLERAGPDPETGGSRVQIAEELGLVIARPPEWREGPAYREFFRDRLMVPELRRGRAIWLIGRTVEDPPPRQQADGAAPDVQVRRGPPKYLSLPGQRPVLGLERAVGRRVVYVAEGPFDWLAALAWDLAAFSTCGTHFPLERLPALGAALAIYGVYDPDRAGRGATERLAPIFGERWRPIRLPNNLDLAEVAALGAAGHELFEVLVGRARAAAWRAAPVTAH